MIARRTRYSAIAVALATTAALSACEGLLDTAGSRVRPKASGSGALKTDATARPGETPGPAATPTAGATASPTVRPTQGNVFGSPTPTPSGSVNPDDVSGAATGQGSASISLVKVEPAALSLNRPSADGTNPAGYAVSKQLLGEAHLTEGGTDSLGVTWSVADTLRLAITEGGVVSVKAGAATGSTLVTAASKRNPAVSRQVTVTITSDGKLALSILPALPAGRESDFSTNVVARRLGAAILSAPATGDIALRLPAATGYQVVVEREEATDSTAVPIGPKGRIIRTAAILGGLDIAANAVATAAITLEASASGGQ